ncbi:MAG: hypothetical protein LC749_02510 [Actinobacteria bacterium]|nr:hypothetical protein [Actinomycetota bacterium]
MTTRPTHASDSFRGQVSGWKASRRGEQSAPMLTDVPLYTTGDLSIPIRTSQVAGRIFSVGNMDVTTGTIRLHNSDTARRWDDTDWAEPGDTPWRKRLRRHQSWYRDKVLGLPPGTIPSHDGSPRPVASRLPAWAVTEDPTLNFLANEEIYEVVLDRLAQKNWGGIVEPHRLHHSLLSSQPLCFNLFAVLSEYGRDELAVALSTALRLNVRSILDVRIEYRPRFDDGFRTGSAFDAFIDYETDQDRGFLGIETKYAEDLSAQKARRTATTR